MSRRWPVRRPAVVAAAPVVAAALVLAGCGNGPGTVGGSAGGDCAVGTPEELEVTTVGELPHDPEAYTQGLVTVGDDLWESTGLRGESDLRRVQPATGEVLALAPLEDDLFGEGLAVAEGGELVQLTWTSGTALRWDPEGPTPTGSFTYEGEGWGLSTIDDGGLVMSDGSEVLTVRSPEDFSVLRSIEVTREGGGADRLNELEWDGERLWANRWPTDEILRIDLDCGVVDGVVDASPLTARAEEVMASRGLERDTAERDVLNGIALAGGDGDAYLVTGKRWPVLFEVEFSPSG